MFRLIVNKAMRLFRALILGIVLAGIGIITEESGLGAYLEESVGLFGFFHLRQWTRPLHPPDDVVIVEIDRVSSDEVLHKPDPDSKDWPRELHARFIDVVSQAGAAFIIFDTVFRDPGDPEADRLLADAIRASGKTVLSVEIDVPPDDEENVGTFQPVPSIPMLETAAIGSATNPVPELENRDYATFFYPFSEYTGDRPTLPTLALQLYLLRHARPALLELPDTQSAALGKALGESEPKPDDFRTLLDKLDRWGRTHHKAGKPLFGERARHRPGRPEDIALAQWFRLYRKNAPSFLLFNHYGPSGSIKTCRYVDVLKGIGPPGCKQADLAGKMVFVGFSADFQAGRNREIFKTVFSRISMVELLATSFANLVQGKAIEPVSEKAVVAILTAWGLAIGVLAMLVSFRTMLGMVSGVSMLFLGVSFFLFINDHRWLAWGTPVLVQATLGLMASFFRIFQPSFRGSGIILGSDAEGSARVAGELDKIRLDRFHKEYFAAIDSRALLNEGIFANREGNDTWYGFWKSKQDPDACRRRACSAALEIAETTVLTPQRFGVSMPLRIGLHFGEFKAKAKPNLERTEYTFHGTEVNNIASRIQSINKYLEARPRVLVSRAALPERGRETLLTRKLGVFQMQNLSQPYEIHHVMGVANRCPPEMAILRDRFEAAVELWLDSRWREAYAAFRTLKDDFPDDGPTDFYIKRFEGGRPIDPSPIIRIDK